MIAWLHTAICALTTEDGRKGWAMLAALGCCVVETAIVVWAMWLVSNNPWLAFLIGLGGQLTNLVVVTGLMVLLGVKRKTKTNLKDGTVEVSDQ
jgi:hypothetical protein